MCEISSNNILCFILVEIITMSPVPNHGSRVESLLTFRTVYKAVPRHFNKGFGLLPGAG